MKRQLPGNPPSSRKIPDDVSINDYSKSHKIDDNSKQMFLILSKLVI